MVVIALFVSVRARMTGFIVINYSTRLVQKGSLVLLVFSFSSTDNVIMFNLYCVEFIVVLAIVK